MKHGVAFYIIAGATEFPATWAEDLPGDGRLTLISKPLRVRRREGRPTHDDRRGNGARTKMAADTPGSFVRPGDNSTLNLLIPPIPLKERHRTSFRPPHTFTAAAESTFYVIPPL